MFIYCYMQISGFNLKKIIKIMIYSYLFVTKCNRVSIINEAVTLFISYSFTVKSCVKSIFKIV